MNKISSVPTLRKIALLLAICIAAAFFYACSDEEEEATPIPTIEPIHSLSLIHI